MPTKRNNYRKKQKAPIRWQLPNCRWLVPYVLVALLTFCVWWIWSVMTAPGAFPLRSIQVVTNEPYLSRDKVEQVVSQHLQGGFFTLKSEVLSQAILALPWVKAVSLRREWPSGLKVLVSEYRPFARWNSQQVVTAKGVVLTPHQLPGGLLALNGPAGSTAKVMQWYRRFTLALLPLGLQVKALTLTARGAWQMTLSNGVHVMLGRHEVMSRFKRFVLLYPAVVKQPAQIAQVDLRYPNGLAIRRRADT